MVGFVGLVVGTAVVDIADGVTVGLNDGLVVVVGFTVVGLAVVGFAEGVADGLAVVSLLEGVAVVGFGEDVAKVLLVSTNVEGLRKGVKVVGDFG